MTSKMVSNQVILKRTKPARMATIAGLGAIDKINKWLDGHVWYFIAWIFGLAMGYFWAWCALNKIALG